MYSLWVMYIISIYKFILVCSFVSHLFYYFHIAHVRICLAYAHQWIYRIWGGWSGKQLGGMVWERIGYFGRLYTPATNHSLECLKVSFLISTIHGCSQIWRNHHGSNSQSSTYQGSITLVLTIYVAEPAVRDAPIVSCVVASMWRDKWL